MKSFAYTLFLIIGTLIFTLTGCKKDDGKQPDACAQVTCQNGGTCNNGACDCPTGYSGTNCEIKNTTQPTFSINSSPQIYFLIDGSEVKISAAGDYELFNGSSKSISIDSSQASYNGGIYKDNGPHVSEFSLHIGTAYFVGSMPSNSNFQSLFTTGTKPYSENAIDGILLSYTDQTGKEWTTSLGSGNQNGSSFLIKENKFYNNFFNEREAKIWAEFNCKLYDGSGASKTVTNGVVIMTFVNN